MNKLIYITAMFLLLFPDLSFSGWQGPTVYMNANWGIAPGELGRKQNDSNVDLPLGFCVTSNAYVVIGDDINNRIQVFKPDGSINSVFGPPNVADNSWKDGWPLNFDCANNYIYTTIGSNRLIYNLDGSLKYDWGVDKVGFVKSLSGDNMIIKKNNLYFLYSIDGQLVQSYPAKPAELGDIIQFDVQNDGNYKAAVKYDDITYGFKISSEIKEFARDTGRNLNVLFNASSDAIHYKINKYNKCGKVIASLDLPDDVYDEDTENEFAIESYSKPVITFNSDVYVARISDTYSILKWAWQDEPNMQSGPDAPAAIRIKPRTGSIYVRWDFAPQDPGCVTGYEISRSETSGGTFSVLATVESGKSEFKDTTAVAGKTYFYKVRSISGTDFSPYSVEASGKR